MITHNLGLCEDLLKIIFKISPISSSVMIKLTDIIINTSTNPKEDKLSENQHRTNSKTEI